MNTRLYYYYDNDVKLPDGMTEEEKEEYLNDHYSWINLEIMANCPTYSVEDIRKFRENYENTLPFPLPDLYGLIDRGGLSDNFLKATGEEYCNAHYADPERVKIVHERMGKF